MKKEILNVGKFSAVLWGEKSDKIYLYIHGQVGNKEEAEVLSEMVCPYGWQVLSIDIPEDLMLPWKIVPELIKALEYIDLKWKKKSLCANSLGAYFSLLSFKEIKFEKVLFISPVLNMERLIKNMMSWAGVTESQLEKEKIIQTSFGQTLSWEYLTYVKNNPIENWKTLTYILYAEKDNITELCVVDDFVKKFNCHLTIMENGEHWFHTPEQIEFLKKWIKGSA